MFWSHFGLSKSLLIPVIMSKLPLDSLQAARVTTGNIWELKEMLSVIKEEVVARELSYTVRVNEKTMTNPDKKAFSPTAAALMVGNNTSR